MIDRLNDRTNESCEMMKLRYESMNVLKSILSAANKMIIEKNIGTNARFSHSNDAFYVLTTLLVRRTEHVRKYLKKHPVRESS